MAQYIVLYNSFITVPLNYTDKAVNTNKTGYILSSYRDESVLLVSDYGMGSRELFNQQPYHTLNNTK